MTRGRQQQENHPRASDSRTAACIHPPATGCEPYAAEPLHGWNRSLVRVVAQLFVDLRTTVPRPIKPVPTRTSSPGSGSSRWEPATGSGIAAIGCAIATGTSGVTASGDTAAATGSSASTRKPAVVAARRTPRTSCPPFLLPGMRPLVRMWCASRDPGGSSDVPYDGRRALPYVARKGQQTSGE